MIAVSISINAESILARSARNQDVKNSEGETLYVTDAGDEIYHLQSDGAVELAIKMLKTINTDRL